MNIYFKHCLALSREFQAYSIATDESTEIEDTAKFTLFICGCNSNLLVTEELLELIPVHGNYY
jgi:hypothetical protein